MDVQLWLRIFLFKGFRYIHADKSTGDRIKAGYASDTGIFDVYKNHKMYGFFRILEQRLSVSIHLWKMMKMYIWYKIQRGPHLLSYIFCTASHFITYMHYQTEFSHVWANFFFCLAPFCPSVHRTPDRTLSSHIPGTQWASYLTRSGTQSVTPWWSKKRLPFQNRQGGVFYLKNQKLKVLNGMIDRIKFPFCFFNLFLVSLDLSLYDEQPFPQRSHLIGCAAPILHLTEDPFLLLL